MSDLPVRNEATIGTGSDPLTATPRHSMARRALLLMGLRIAAVIIAVTGLSYWHVYGTVEERARETLGRTVELQGRAESQRFLLAQQETVRVRDEFLRRLALLGAADPQADFDRVFAREDDGLIRVRPEINDPAHHATAYLRHDVGITADLRRRLLTGWRLLDEWGPILTDSCFSAFITMPEQSSIDFCPLADRGRTAGRLTDTSSEETVRRSTPERNPSRSTFWTGVYFDEGMKQWLVSCVSPGDADGRWLMSAGQNVPVDDLIRRTAGGAAEGAWSMIVDRGRHLIAHPQLSGQIVHAGGNLAVDQLADRTLIRMVDAAMQTRDTGVVAPSDIDALLAVTRIAGPDWLLITVHPRQLLVANAASTARVILSLGVLSLAAELLILWLILRRQITEPIADVVGAADRISRGDFSIKLDVQRDDELGRLARAVNRMAKVVGERDTALGRQVAEIEQARQVAENANLAKAEFLGTMSHELRTPLNGVIGMTELMSSTQLTAQQREYLDTISLSGRALLAIIDDILDFTKLDAGKLRLEPRAIDLRPIITGVVAMLKPQTDAKQVNLLVEFAPDLPARVYADPLRVRQVLTNLASNAVKFTERGSVTVRLSCPSAPDGKAEIHLAVTDTGPGIAAAHLPLLGEKFRQLDGSFSRRYGGTGLGIAITKSLLALMDGELLVTSVLRQGSTFTAVMRLRLST